MHTREYEMDNKNGGEPGLEKVDMVKTSSDESVAQGEIDLTSTPEYTEAEFKKLRRKIDRYLLPLMWFCYGIQQTDKIAIGTQAIFGIREDTGLVGQQYSWVTTIFYLTYMIFEIPSSILLQRFPIGLTLSWYMLCWGVVVLCIGFAQNFTHLVLLRSLQGIFECSISPGFLLIIGSWYRTREHTSRSLVFQSANAGFSCFASLILYGIGSLGYKDPSFQAWRYMSFFLGSITIAAAIACLILLGTPSEVRWLSHKEKQVAMARVLDNNAGSDKTGTKKWKWEQVLECARDPCFWFAGLSSFLSSVPNGGLSTFGSIIASSFGFSNLQVILLSMPKDIVSVLYFCFIGVVTSKYKNLRMYFMMFSVLPPLTGFLLMALLPDTPELRWARWGSYFATVTFVIALFLTWTLIPSNTAGRTKLTMVTSFTFICYCVGNMIGSQVFMQKDAPRYLTGTVTCCACFTLEFLLIVIWRLVLMRRNKVREERLLMEGITEEERQRRGRELGEQDVTDLQNPYFRYVM